MATFERKTENLKDKAVIRLQPDMQVTMGAGAVKHLQPIAQDKTDGKFYAYVKDDPNKGVIAWLYMGADTTAEADDVGYISTYVVVGKEDIQGIEWESDFTAIHQLKVAGVILTTKIEGTEEA